MSLLKCFPAIFLLVAVTFAPATASLSAVAPTPNTPPEALMPPCLKASRKEVEKQIKDISADYFDMEASKITDDTKFVANLHADHVNLIDLVRNFNEEFHIRIPLEKADTILNVKDAVEFVITRQCE
jgi:acyl carrier protein